MTHPGRCVELVEILQRALGEAEQAGHPFLGTEHVFLALLQEENDPAVYQLQAFGLDWAAVKEEIRQHAGGAEPQQTGVPRLQTPRLRRILQRATELAHQQQASQVLSIHILAALLEEGEGVAARILARHGLDLATACRWVLAAEEKEEPTDEITYHRLQLRIQDELEQVRERFQAQGVRIDLDEAVVDLLTDRALYVRLPVGEVIEQQFLRPLQERLDYGVFRAGDRIVATSDGVRVAFVREGEMTVA